MKKFLAILLAVTLAVSLVLLAVVALGNRRKRRRRNSSISELALLRIQKASMPVSVGRGYGGPRQLSRISTL